MTVRGGLYILLGELEDIILALKHSLRTEVDHDPLLGKFLSLKSTIVSVTDLCEIDLCIYLQPFLDLIKSEDTSGTVTGLALSSLNKFILCNLIDYNSANISSALESISDAVTHARFVGTEQVRDEVVLMQILQALRSLILSTCGNYLSNQSICEILQSCFRICLELRLSELLRKAAEQILFEIVKLLFVRLPQFRDEPKNVMSHHNLKLNTTSISSKRKKKSFKNANNASLKPSLSAEHLEKLKIDNNEVNKTEYVNQASSEIRKFISQPDLTDSNADAISNENDELDSLCDLSDSASSMVESEFVNPRGIRFTQDSGSTEVVSLTPYGLPCLHEVFRFLTSLVNIHDRHNSEQMVKLGLSMLVIAFEMSADNIANCAYLMTIVVEDLTKYLYALLGTKRSSLFHSALRLSFLVYESMRHSLKLQLESYLTRMMEYIKTDHLVQPKAFLEQKECALEFIIKLLKIPGFAAELYINYDCDLYCTNLFEDLTKLLSKNAFPVSGLLSTHVLSLEALMAIIETVSSHCTKASSEALNDEENLPKLKINFIKHRKRLLESGSELFNQKQKRGIDYLQENDFLSKNLDPDELAKLFYVNWRLDKKVIGDFLSQKSHAPYLIAFMKKFSFENKRIDEALRMFLEAFRLPGESPLIINILEHFAAFWHECNGRPFDNVDATFTLAYSVIQLNTDQHNPQAKKHNKPMSLEDYKKILTGVNNGNDFNSELLEAIYNAIRSEEIVMPSEQSGAVKENFLWRNIIIRNNSSVEPYISARDGAYNFDIFSLVWGSTVAALSFVFDKSVEEKTILRSINGFRKCAQIAAFYGSGDVFDNLVISLCKFTTLINITEDGVDLAPIYFGYNGKAQLAAKTMFTLAHNQGDTLREGWKNIIDCIQNLFKCHLLPKDLVETEDFIDPSTKISLLKEEMPTKTLDNTGLFGSFYLLSFLGGGNESNQPKELSAEDAEALDYAKACITECKPEQLITESKFLKQESLMELIKALIYASKGLEARLGEGVFEEDVAVFNLELLIRVAIQNKDRFNIFFSELREHFYQLIVNSSKYNTLVERAIVGLIRIIIRLLRIENISNKVIHALQIFLHLKLSVLKSASKQISFGMHELIKTNAANIHNSNDWSVVFAVLEVVGVGARISKIMETSEHIIDSRHGKSSLFFADKCFPKVSKERINIFDLNAFVKCTECLAFIIRDAAHVTPYNFEICVYALQLFADAIVTYNITVQKKSERQRVISASQSSRSVRRSRTVPSNLNENPPVTSDDEEGYLSDDSPNSSFILSTQILDFMYTLHTKSASIFTSWASSEADVPGAEELWTNCWLPLLQGISTLCCDIRRSTRMAALACMQRALLISELQSLGSLQWEECFSKVLFPLMYKYIESTTTEDVAGMDETRTRAATLLCKVFLQRLNTLVTLPNFVSLWLDILTCMERYMKFETSDLLKEAIPESLKNMLLVMHTTSVFDHNDSQFSILTWKKINSFLPELRSELFHKDSLPTAEHSSTRAATPPLSQTIEVPPIANVILQPPLPDTSQYPDQVPLVLNTQLTQTHSASSLPVSTVVE